MKEKMKSIVVLTLTAACCATILYIVTLLTS